MADGRLFGSSDTSLINLDDSCIYCNNIVKYLSIIDKGKLKWNGSLENLMAFMDKLLERKTSWTSTGGDYKRLELVNSIIRWLGFGLGLGLRFANNIWRRKRRP